MAQNQSSFTPLDAEIVANVAADLVLTRDIRPEGCIGYAFPSPLTERGINQPSSIDRECMQLWRASRTRRDYCSFNPDVETEALEAFRIVWKTCERVFWVTPDRILSFRHKLRYRPTPAPGVEASHVVYTPKFSRLLAELAVHPCWQDRADMLVMAIQYTVTVRVDNRLFWPFPDEEPDQVGDCPALNILLEMYYEEGEEPLATMSAHMHHLRARAQTESPSELSDFLVFLGEIARMYPSSEYSQTYLGCPMLSVTTKDLQIITEAVKRFNWDNVDWTESPEEIFKAFERKGGLSGDQHPRTTEMLDGCLYHTLIENYYDIADCRNSLRARWRVDNGGTNNGGPNLPGETPSDYEVLGGDESELELGP